MEEPNEQAHPQRSLGMPEAPQLQGLAAWHAVPTPPPDTVIPALESISVAPPYGEVIVAIWFSGHLHFVYCLENIYF